MECLLDYSTKFYNNVFLFCWLNNFWDFILNFDSSIKFRVLSLGMNINLSAIVLFLKINEWQLFENLELYLRLDLENCGL